MLESFGDYFSDDSVEDRRATMHLRHLSLYREELERVMVISEGEDPDSPRSDLHRQRMVMHVMIWYNNNKDPPILENG